jgi:hypothetical protein
MTTHHDNRLPPELGIDANLLTMRQETLLGLLVGSSLERPPYHPEDQLQGLRSHAVVGGVAWTSYLAMAWRKRWEAVATNEVDRRAYAHLVGLIGEPARVCLPACRTWLQEAVRTKPSCECLVDLMTATITAGTADEVIADALAVGDALLKIPEAFIKHSLQYLVIRLINHHGRPRARRAHLMDALSSTLSPLPDILTGQHLLPTLVAFHLGFGHPLTRCWAIAQVTGKVEIDGEDLSIDQIEGRLRFATPDHCLVKWCEDQQRANNLTLLEHDTIRAGLASLAIAGVLATMPEPSSSSVQLRAGKLMAALAAHGPGET